MTANNFEASLKRVLRDEGGYSNDKGDPGGATMWGITHIDYDAYRRRRGLTAQDVRRMTTAERDDIYKSKYWTGARCDDLPDGVDYVVFDGAVNSGVSQSIKWLQRAIGGVVVDGHAGDVTVQAAIDGDAEAIIRSICDQRLRFLQSLRTFSRFGKGWTRRVEGVEAFALGELGRGDHEHTAVATMGGAKAKIIDQSEPVVSQGTATGGTAATATAASIVQQVQQYLAPYSDTLSAIKYALVAAAVLGLLVTIYTIWKGNQMRAVS